MGKKNSKRQKRLVRKSKRMTKMTSSPPNLPLTADEVKNIPPHMLDRIPAQMSLRPNAQSLRAMMMQRYAPPFMSMPVTPQQQQVQNLKNNNDVKEQAINQAKQDLIVENERKRSLIQQAADQKREYAQQKQELDHEKLDLKQKQEYEKDMNALSLEIKRLKFEKSKYDDESEAMKKKYELETQMALAEQMKYENQKLKQKIENDKFDFRIKSLSKENKMLKVENEALTNAVSKLNDEEQLNEIRTLAENIAVNKAKNMLIKKLNDEQNLMLQYKLEDVCKATPEALDEQIGSMNEKITQYQTAIVAQMNDKFNKERMMKKYEFYKSTLTDEQNKEERLKIENLSLDRQLRTLNEGNNDREVKEMVQKNVKQQFDNEQLKEKIQIQKDINKGEQDKNLYDTKMTYLNSEEYKNTLKDLYLRNETQNQLNYTNKLRNETLEAHDQYLRSLAQKNIADIVYNASLSGEDVDECLTSSIPSTSDGMNRSTTHHNIAAFNQLVAQNQTAGQEDMERADIINYLKGVEETGLAGAHLLQDMKRQNKISSYEGMPLGNLREFRDVFIKHMGDFANGSG